jgi:transcriptional regulator with AAA-type ATPase domain
MRDPTDHIREVPIGATETIRTDCKGNISELGNNVYQYGTGDQGDRFTKTAEEIADMLEESIVKR